MKKNLITFPCKVGELIDRLQSAVSDGLDKDEICTSGYDGDGDCIFVTQDYSNNQNKGTNDVTMCKHRLGIFCESQLVKEYNNNQIMVGGSPFICPFTIGTECREYRELKHNED